MTCTALFEHLAEVYISFFVVRAVKAMLESIYHCIDGVENSHGN